MIPRKVEKKSADDDQQAPVSERRMDSSTDGPIGPMETTAKTPDIQLERFFYGLMSRPSCGDKSKRRTTV